ncbi:MAG: hypothetical protein HOK97_07930, partial [Deltaproteobacteria bacterium]|nr:hypothetical protein [Deltaproteobacteria bacterium]
MKYYIQAWALLALFILAACTQAKPEEESAQAGFVLPIGQSLSADGLMAEIAVYSAGFSPQLEGSIETIALRESGGRL